MQMAAPIQLLMTAGCAHPHIGASLSPKTMAATPTVIVEAPRRSRRGREVVGGSAGTTAAFREIFCAATTALARDQALPYLRKKYAHYGSWGQDDGHPADDGRSWDADAPDSHHFILGDPEYCRAELARFREAVGVDEYILRTEWPDMPHELALSSLDLLSREVVPNL